MFRDRHMSSLVFFAKTLTRSCTYVKPESRLRKPSKQGAVLSSSPPACDQLMGALDAATPDQSALGPPGWSRVSMSMPT